MFCNHCGKQTEADARFCSFCGTAVAQAGFPPPRPRQRLGGITRPRHPRIIAGVCAGIAQHLGWDVALVRLALVISVVFAGTGVFAYILAWIIIPEAPYTLPMPEGSQVV